MSKLTLEHFVSRANQIHANRYNYEKTVYVNNNTKVQIDCPDHGPFFQVPASHLIGAGCKICYHGRLKQARNPLRLSSAEFIERARQKHGDRYFYDQLNYVSYHTKVQIGCSIHGPFLQAPSAHLAGKGCKHCGFSRGSSNQRGQAAKDFVDKARRVHGDRYDYRDTVYVAAKKNVTIICPVHGRFVQTPSDHHKGHGCKQCGVTRRSFASRRSPDDFFTKAIELHKGFYDYDKAIYRGNLEKIKIHCPKHGLFEQTPKEHLKGAGCVKCFRLRIAQLHSRSPEEFKQRAEEVHEGRYSYEHVQYRNNGELVIITCKKHGPFEQTPGSHLAGHGCSKCTYRVSKASTEWLDYLRVPGREVRLRVGSGRPFLVDGYDELSNTVYQFHGDYWHGNPLIFNQHKTHPESKRPLVNYSFGL
jgi:hypothetical protein